MPKSLPGALLMSVLLALVLSGCEQYGEKKRANALNDSVKYYTAAIRWGNFESAASAIRPRNGNPVPISVDHLKGVRVLSNDYQILASSPEASEAQMYATFTWQPADSASVQTTNQQATWWFDDQTQRWYLDATAMPF